MSRWPRVPLGEVLTLYQEAHEVDIERSYPNAGILNNGRGMFRKPDIAGSSTSASVLYRIAEGDFIYSRLFAFEGAYTVVPAELDGCFVSNEFPTFKCDPERLLPGYVRWYFKQPIVWGALAAGSKRMGNRRQRVHPDRILEFAIGLPPLDEQRRIVARLDTIEARLVRVQTLKNEIGTEISNFISACNAELAQDKPISLSEAIALNEDQVPVTVGASYPHAGLRGFARGLFNKAAVLGEDTTYRHFNRIHSNQFVVSQVKGWEGAVAICSPEFDGVFVSPEYRTFDCIDGVLRPKYFSYIIGTEYFLNSLAKLTRGQGARRERLRPEMLLDLSIKLPTATVQERLEQAFEKVGEMPAYSTTKEFDCLLPSLLHQAFG